MFGLGVQELLIILLLVLVFFGAEKIPQLAKSLGKGIGEFRRAQQDVKDELFREAEPRMPGDGTPPAPQPLVCPSCQGLTAAGSLYCSQCGQRFAPQPSCSVCLRILAPEEKFCPNCGEPRP